MASRPPAIEKVLSHPLAAPLIARYGRNSVKEAARAAARASRNGDVPRLLEACARALEGEFTPEAPRVVNATGVLIHTNIGRAPLAPSVVRAIAEAAEGYHAVELDLASGKRGGRGRRTAALLSRLVGAEDALVVNNNAAAVLLALASAAAGREVLVSRGELVAIGGSFQIPEILATSGARLKEVGTTNRTRIEDYVRAFSPAVAALLTVHPSNYEVRGYVRRAAFPEIADFCRRRRLPWIHDHGSGTIEDLSAYGIAGVERAADALRAGAALTAFSGDKLFGGPQAGILAGKRRAIDACRRHPIARAVRADKITLAGTFETAAVWLTRGASALPLYALAAASIESLRARAARAGALLPRGIRSEVVESEAVFGGGTTPERTLPSIALAISGASRPAEELAAALRRARPPVVGRVSGRRLLLDFRTVPVEEDDRLGDALRAL